MQIRFPVHSSPSPGFRKLWTELQTESMLQLTSTKSFYEQMSQTIDQAFQSQSQDASSVASTLDLLSDRVNTIVQSYQGIRDSIAQIADAHPELSDLTAPILAKLDDSIAVQEELRDKLTNAASSLRDTAGNVTTSKKELDDLISSSISGIAAVKSDYEPMYLLL